MQEIQIGLCCAVLCLCAVGDVPLEWYKDEDHIGYDIEVRECDVHYLARE
jgi:hypothetical protein